MKQGKRVKLFVHFSGFTVVSILEKKIGWWLIFQDILGSREPSHLTIKGQKVFTLLPELMMLKL